MAESFDFKFSWWLNSQFFYSIALPILLKIPPKFKQYCTFPFAFFSFKKRHECHRIHTTGIYIFAALKEKISFIASEVFCTPWFSISEPQWNWSVNLFFFFFSFSTLKKEFAIWLPRWSESWARTGRCFKTSRLGTRIGVTISGFW